MDAHNPTYEFWRIRIFSLTWLTYAGFYLTRKSFPIAKVGLLADPAISLTKTQLGWIDLANQIAYAIGQFVWGVCGDKLGPRVVILGGLFVSVFVGILCGFTTTFWMFMLLMFIQGLAQATGWSNLLKNMSSWFSRGERGVVMGWWCSNYAIGGLIASPYAGLAADAFGHWKFAFFIPAITLFGVFLLFFFFQRNRPEDVGLPPIEEYHGVPAEVLEEGETPDEEPEGSSKVIWEVLTNKTVWLLAIVYLCLKPTRYAILFWGPAYMNEQFGSGMAQSGLLSAFFELAGPVGTLAAGFLSDKLFGSRRMPACVLFLIGLSVVLVFFHGAAESGKIATVTMLFAMGFFLYGPDSMVSATSAMDFGTKKGAATAAGLINGMGSIGGALGGALPGYVSDEYGWNVIFTSLAAASLLAALILIPFWNTMPPTASRKN